MAHYICRYKLIREKSAKHLRNVINLGILGSVTITLFTAKFCGKYEIPLRSNNKTQNYLIFKIIYRHKTYFTSHIF